MNKNTFISLLFVSSIFLFVSSSSAKEFVMQVPSGKSCGTGCSIKLKQTSPLIIFQNTRQVYLESQIFAESRLPIKCSEEERIKYSGWLRGCYKSEVQKQLLFADCDRKTVSWLSFKDDTSFITSVFTYNAFDERGRRNNSTVSGNAFDFFKRMCIPNWEELDRYD